MSKIALLTLLAMASVVLAVVAVVIPKARENAARTQCMNNLKQIGLGTASFESTFNRLPPLYGGAKDEVQNSRKFNTTWASIHFFISFYIGDESFYEMRRYSSLMIFDPSSRTFGGPYNEKVFPCYVCPADPSMRDGIIIGERLGGSSYAANAQVFAPLTDETLSGGMMYSSDKADFTDRGTTTGRIKDGIANVIFFTHTYAVCGNGQGSAWGYSAGFGHPPSAVHTWQPWSRASYLGQTYMTSDNAPVFQNQTEPYSTCKTTDPATPHFDSMLVALGDASVRSINSTILPRTWNMACLPNDGGPLPPDW